MEADNWINDILNSTNGMVSVSPNANLFTKMENKLITKLNTFSSKTVWSAAASIVVLITINIFSIQNNKSTSNTAPETIIASSIEKSNQLY